MGKMELDQGGYLVVPMGGRGDRTPKPSLLIKEAGVPRLWNRRNERERPLGRRSGFRSLHLRFLDA